MGSIRVRGPGLDVSRRLLQEFAPSDPQALRRIMAAALSPVSGLQSLGVRRAAALLARLEIGRRAVEEGAFGAEQVHDGRGSVLSPAPVDACSGPRDLPGAAAGPRMRAAARVRGGDRPAYGSRGSEPSRGVPGGPRGRRAWYRARPKPTQQPPVSGLARPGDHHFSSRKAATHSASCLPITSSSARKATPQRERPGLSRVDDAARAPLRAASCAAPSWEAGQYGRTSCRSQRW
jgi:hypothetical protein